MNTTPPSTPRAASTTTPDRPLIGPRERALVLGGGGSSGNAWLIGVMAGLSDAGLDVTTADLTIGTSAGATTAAQVTAVPPNELFAATMAAAPQRPVGRASADRPDPGKAVADHLARMTRMIAAAADAADLRRTIGAAALALPGTSDDEVQDRWRTTVAARLPSHAWPERPLIITAVDARTGEPVVFDRASGVDLVDAVAASCASGFAYRIGDGRYIDGGYRSGAENADLAAGYARVLVLAPFGGRTLTPVEWGMHLATQVDGLRADGSRVETVVPESDVEHLFGAAAMDLSLRPHAARAGYDQGAALAERLTEWWQ